MTIMTPARDITGSNGQTMRALLLETHGGPFRETRIARPQPASGEVLVRIAASGVNPLDLKIRAGQAEHARHPLPATRPEMTGDLTRVLGELVLTQYVLPFELLAVLMLAGMIGAIYFARPEE